MAAPGSATCPADVSTGPPNADVIMAFDDVSIDRVNIDQVNGQTGSTSRWGPHVSGNGSLTSGSRVSGLGKRKRKRELRLCSWAQRETGRLKAHGSLGRLGMAQARSCSGLQAGLRTGPAQTDRQAGSARLLDWAFGHWRPTSISSSSFLLFSSPASSH